VRSHAKASSAATGSGRAKGLLRVFFASAFLGLLTATPASALQGHSFLETFGSAAKPSFSSAQGVAVDQSSGQVLVMDDGSPPSIKRYNPDGTPANFAGLGTNVIDGKGNGNCATVPAECDQTPQNGLDFAAPSESQIAVDNSGGATHGNIYVTQSFPNLINVFSKEGVYLGQLSAAGAAGFSEACGVAVDPSGAVYVGDYGSGIHKFAPAANPPVNGDHVATFTLTASPCTLAAGAGPTAGFLFPAQWQGPVSKIDSTSGALKYVVASDSHMTVSVDPASGHLYAASGSTVTHYDASGASSASQVQAISAASAVRGIALRGSNANLYLSREGAANLDVYGVVELPEASTGVATNITKETATLNGSVNPGGVLLTECKFEFGTSASYGQSVPCAESPASIGSGTSPVPVHADIAGLTEGTVYHFRLVAMNANGAAQGSDKTFETTSAPLIKEAWAASVVFREATLKAKIHPKGLASTYHVEYGTTPAYGQSTTEKSFGSDSNDHIVSLTLEGLAPDTVYHWRVVATNSVGTSEGSDHTFTTYAIPSLETNCPNQDLRYGHSAKLPDCRAYEMVSPVDKAGGEIMVPAEVANGNNLGGWHKASLDGNKLTYTAPRAFGDSASAKAINQFIASRGPGGWSTHGINAPQGRSMYDPLYGIGEVWSPFRGFTSDLSSAWTIDYNKFPLASGGREGVINAYRRDNESDSYEAINPAAPLLGQASYDVQVTGFSDDGSRAFFSAPRPLTPDAALNTRYQAYEFSDGELELISILPNGDASTADSGVGTFRSATTDSGTRLSSLDNAVSDDGSRVFWTTSSELSPSTIGRIYVRINGETTVPVSGSVGPGGGFRFQTASTDGSKALFSFGEDVGPLYEFDVDTETPTLIAGQTIGVAGAADDLSHVYFVSEEALDAGATAGQWNLYLYREGELTFIAAIDPNPFMGGYSNTSPNPLFHAARATPDGRHLTFISTRNLTGYDNADALTGQPVAEVFLYDADSDELSCASCNPSEARPAGAFPSQPWQRNPGFPSTLRAAAWIPTWEWSLNELRPLSDDGNRFFFNAFDALVPQDTNGVQDVYQWEAPGSGGCAVGSTAYSAVNDGCISLISTGQSPVESEFIDASADGGSVFMRTQSSIDPEDPGLLDLYVARVNGGYPQPPTPIPCVGDACQSVPPAPNDPTPASASFRGAGDPAPRKPHRNCRAQRKRAGKASAQAKRKGTKRCRGVKRRATR
jgi:hypothetical protein